MKKALSLILCSAFLVSICHPAKASPVQEPETISVTDVKQSAFYEVPTLSINYVSVMDAGYSPITAQVNEVSPSPVSTVQMPEKVMLTAEPLAPDGRIFIHRHYFDQEDNNPYPEYKPGDISAGFTNDIYVPARK